MAVVIGHGPSLGHPAPARSGDVIIAFQPNDGGGHIAIWLTVPDGAIYHRAWNGWEWETTVADHRAPGGQGHWIKRISAEAAAAKALLFISGPAGESERVARKVANLLARSHRRNLTGV